MSTTVNLIGQIEFSASERCEVWTPCQFWDEADEASATKQAVPGHKLEQGSQLTVGNAVCPGNHQHRVTKGEWSSGGWVFMASGWSPPWIPSLIACGSGRKPRN